MNTIILDDLAILAQHKGDHFELTGIATKTLWCCYCGVEITPREQYKQVINKVYGDTISSIFCLNCSDPDAN